MELRQKSCSVKGFAVGIIERVNDILKTVCDTDHSPRRSPANMLINTFAALIAYATLEGKPSIFY